MNRNFTNSIMLGSFAFGILGFILPIYGKNLGGNALAIGGLFSVFSGATLVLRPLIGKGLDKYGRKIFFLLAFGFYAAAMLLYSYATTLELLYLSRIVQAIGSAFMFSSAYSIAVDLSDSNSKGSSVGAVDGASATGALYGSIFGFLVLSNMTLVTGWSFLFKIYAVLSMLGGYLAYRYLPETKKMSSERMPPSKLNPKFYPLLLVIFISAISTSMITPLLMIYLQDKFTTDISTLAMAYIPAALVYAYLPAKLGAVSDRIGRLKPMILGLFLSGIVSIFIPILGSISFLVLLWATESIGIVMASPAQEAFVGDLSEEHNRGYSYGIYTFIISLGACIGPILGGWLYDSYSHALPFFVNGFILLTNVVLVYFLLREKGLDIESTIDI